MLKSVQNTYIQRSSGCDHMHCTRCQTNFCYRCGDKLRRLKFFGDHYSKLSVFGCKYRYKAESPVQRKLIRGAVFGTKIMIAPVLGSLVICAGAMIFGVAIAALPLYSGIRLYRFIQRSKIPLKEQRAKMINSKNDQTIHHPVVIINGEQMYLAETRHA
ncbi:putative E3 ubiquitin-protein ligase RNF217-like protein [Dinothrombium tinctorium]|uniref:Putative E3 ubiquitin-protein ligase RNF217-like protein n=1 Tax=Dinothrombium tinctorium TaxID=1965070 RepID=A0A443QUT8_9ACAR|nr:putative E3 ubiquitin-protein ligase RNF217-like protein [Dinothrombium tinctorium]